MCVAHSDNVYRVMKFLLLFNIVTETSPCFEGEKCDMVYIKATRIIYLLKIIMQAELFIQ